MAVALSNTIPLDKGKAMEAVKLRVQIPEDRALHLDVPVPKTIAQGAADVTLIIEPDPCDAHSGVTTGKSLADLGGYLKSRNPHPDRRVTVEDMNAAIARRVRERAS